MEWPKAYALRNKDAIRMVCQSGGAFDVLSDYVLENGGTVFGCVLDDKLKAVHIRATNIDERNRMHGSKYVQSQLLDVFNEVANDLNYGKMVLFSGTSCQVLGLRKFLTAKHIEGDLICVDLVCHGVPSPMLWENYLNWQEENCGRKIINVNFRNKRLYGWHSHIETLTTDNGKRISSDVYANLFYSHNALRPCCYECRWKSVMHPGDITIADCWGIENVAPELDDNCGVSLVLVNSIIGEERFSQAIQKDDIICTPIKLEDCMQGPLISPVKKPNTRDMFWKEFAVLDFSKIAKKYGRDGYIKRIRHKIKRAYLIIRKYMKK